MSADLVNLRQVRKRRARDEKARKADENRLAFGRTKSEKDLTAAENRKLHRSLDQKRLDPDSRRPRQEADDHSG